MSSNGSRTSGHDAGLLIAIGGAEDKTRERKILRRFVEAAGGAKARIAILATASALPDTGEKYREVFSALDVGEIVVLNVPDRATALGIGSAVIEALEATTGFFMTGGGQLRVTSAIGGPPNAASIQRRHEAGMVVAGTSAGASLLSEHMIAFGEGGGTPRQRQVQMAKGLGLAPGLIIDQHFRRRDRLGRLLTALSYNPEPIGLGIDEDTAAVIEPDGMLSVLGTGTVTIVEAAGLTYTDTHHALPGKPLTLLGLRLDVLSDGARYDLHNRRGLPPLEAPVPLADAEEVALAEG